MYIHTSSHCIVFKTLWDRFYFCNAMSQKKKQARVEYLALSSHTTMSPKPNLNLGPRLQIPHQCHHPQLPWCRHTGRAGTWQISQAVCRKVLQKRLGIGRPNFLPWPCPWRAVYPMFVSLTTRTFAFSSDE